MLAGQWTEVDAIDLPGAHEVHSVHCVHFCPLLDLVWMRNDSWPIGATWRKILPAYGSLRGLQRASAGY
jgi:hypothetical protein